jgi:hypothetical protein
MIRYAKDHYCEVREVNNLYFCSVCNKTYEDIEKAMSCCLSPDKEWFSLEETIKILDLDPNEILKEIEKETEE